ncbi:MAG: multicopper oxidase domain-containing protein [Thermodesulfovibrionales bacterium]
MKDIRRRNFLKYAWIGGVLALSKITPLGFLEHAFSEEIKEVKLNASVTTVNIGTGKSFKAWTYKGRIPGPEIRLKEEEIVRVILKNNLPEDTTIHWHGLPVPNKMDGVPNVTQKTVKPGEIFIYEFEAAPPGTYIYHFHAYYQLDRGLYGSLIVEPRREEESYDRDYSLVLEDWFQIDGAGPEASKAGRIRPAIGMGMMARRMMGRGYRSGEPLQEPVYDVYTING